MGPRIAFLISFYVALLCLVMGSVSFRISSHSLKFVDCAKRTLDQTHRRVFALKGNNNARYRMILKGKLGNRDDKGILSAVTATNSMLFANIAVFLATSAMPHLQNAMMKMDHRIARGETYRMATALFAHGGLTHLAMNCLSLRNIGPQTERIFGSPGFMGVYIGSGVLANAATFFLGTAPYSLGASGSTFGLLGAMGGYYYFNKDVLGQRSESVMASIKRNLFMNVFYGLSNPNVDHWAHAFGFGAGFGLSYLLAPRLEPRWGLHRIPGRRLLRAVVAPRQRPMSPLQHWWQRLQTRFPSSGSQPIAFEVSNGGGDEVKFLLPRRGHDIYEEYGDLHDS